MAFEIDFNNESSIEWTKAYSTHKSKSDPKSLPTTTLGANGGSTTYAINRTATTFLKSEEMLMECIWIDPKSGARFGVKATFPGHTGDIGAEPYWDVMSDVVSPDDPAHPADWKSNGSDPASPYQWDDVAGCPILATATAGHTSLTVSVVIQYNS